MRKLNKKAVAGVTAGLMFVGGGAAYAYWTTTGTGTGSGSTGTSAAVAVAQVGTITDLRPGGQPQAIDFKITNPQVTKQYIATVAVRIASVESSPGVAAVGCSMADFDLVQPTAINQDLTSGDTTFQPSGASLALKNLASNQDGCKNVTVNLAFAAS